MKSKIRPNYLGEQTNLLVLRLSAMGDVALTLPVIRSALDAYPNLHILFITKEPFAPLFKNIDRLEIIIADVKGRHKGISGLFRLYRELKPKYEIVAVADIHNVLRSRVLSSFFRLSGTPVFRIDKGRKEKRKLTAKKNKVFRPLTHTIQRYIDVFEKAGFPVTLSKTKNWFTISGNAEKFLKDNDIYPKSGKWIGIAPYSKHLEKMWPPIKMKELIAHFDEKNILMFLFGGGADEIRQLKELEQEFNNVKSVAGELDLTQQLDLISQLNLMISMDSANMHLAWLSGIPVVSVWGATHPYAGFGPLNGNEQFIVQIPFEKLTCRPCSVYGNKPCWRGDHACMEWIQANDVVTMVEKVLDEK